MLADAELIECIQQATRGAARILCAMARQGKAIERDKGPRAQRLIEAVQTHPLYKGGRLAFDMLELEDLILQYSNDASGDVTSVNTVISSVVHSFGLIKIVEKLRQLGIDTDATRSQTGSRDTEFNVAESSSTCGATTNAESEIPRVSFGESDQSIDPKPRTTATESLDEPVLIASDYLYDFVVLGTLDFLREQFSPT